MFFRRGRKPRKITVLGEDVADPKGDEILDEIRGIVPRGYKALVLLAPIEPDEDGKFSGSAGVYGYEGPEPVIEDALAFIENFGPAVGSVVKVTKTEASLKDGHPGGENADLN